MDYVNRGSSYIKEGIANSTVTSAIIVAIIIIIVISAILYAVQFWRFGRKMEGFTHIPTDWDYPMRKDGIPDLPPSVLNPRPGMVMPSYSY